MIRLIPTNIIITLINSTSASTTTALYTNTLSMYNYSLLSTSLLSTCTHTYPCTTLLLYYPQVDCAINHYYHDSEGAWGAFGCDGAWPPG